MAPLSPQRQQYIRNHKEHRFYASHRPLTPFLIDMERANIVQSLSNAQLDDKQLLFVFIRCNEMG